MKAASLKEIKTELQRFEQDQLVDFCLRLIKFKKENKELLTYLIFGADDEQAYIQDTKNEVEEQFKSVSNGHAFFAKKTLRKILRYVNRQCRYSGKEQTELEIRIFYCQQMIDRGISLTKGSVIFNLYHQQVKKITSLVNKLPEDLQFDYERDIKNLSRH